MTLGIHHQWLWGVTAMARLTNFLRLISKCDDYLLTNYVDVIRALQNCYEVDYNTGYTSRTHIMPYDKKGELPENIEDPELGDNNNGITLIDLTGRPDDTDADEENIWTPKYSFMSITHLECLSEVSQAKMYATPEGDEGSAYKNYVPMSAETWNNLHYTKEEPYNGDENSDAILKELKGYQVMTVDDCIEMFPKRKKELKAASKKPVKKTAKKVPAKPTTKKKTAAKTSKKPAVTKTVNMFAKKGKK
jgi:hypothetical protein